MREQRNVLSAESIGIPGAIEPFVMVADDWPDAFQRAQRSAQAIADHRVLLHDVEFGGRQSSRFQQHGVGHANLTDVVQNSAAAQRLDILGL